MSLCNYHINHHCCCLKNDLFDAWIGDGRSVTGSHAAESHVVLFRILPDRKAIDRKGRWGSTVISRRISICEGRWTRVRMDLVKSMQEKGEEEENYYLRSDSTTYHHLPFSLLLLLQQYIITTLITSSYSSSLLAHHIIYNNNNNK